MNLLSKVAVSLAVIFVVLAVTYHVGENAGQRKVMSDWAEENKLRDDATALLNQRNRNLEHTNQELTTRISDEIAARDKAHAEALVAIRADFDERLRTSATRAGIYQRQAQGSAAERERLASYAAELDRSLEQGRSLVRELGETLRQRDDTIRSLSQQIIADRKLLTE